MKLKKLLASILCVALVLSSAGLTALATGETVSEWDGTSYSIEWCAEEKSATGATGGATYHIRSAADLAGLSRFINTWYDNYGTENPYGSNNAFQGDTVILETDIDLKGYEWEPIGYVRNGSDKNAFRGSFDGNGHTIKNIYVPAEKYSYAGLFGKIVTNNFSQTFENITIENANVSSMDSTNNKEGAGALFGDSYGSIISNCHVTGNIAVKSADMYAGALSGRTRSKISDSTVTATGTVEAAGNCAGGLVGEIAYSITDNIETSITNCSVSGTDGGFTVKSSDVYTGGLVGWVPANTVPNLTIDEVSVSDISVVAENSSSGAGVAYIAQNFNATNAVVNEVETTVAGKESIPTDAEAVSTAVATIGSVPYASVQAAVDAAEVGTTEIQLLPGTISENVVIYQVEGKNIVIKGGDDVTCTGSFHICGNNRYNANETITFDGINFNGENVTAHHDFITSTRREYSGATLVWGVPHNVTVKNCTFTGNYDGVSDYDSTVEFDVVALRNVGGYNWTIENCTGTGLHSFMQASANYTDINHPEIDYASEFTNVTVTKSKSGLNLGTNANYTITNSTFDVVEYALRADANSDRNVNLKVAGCDIAAENAFIIRNADSANYTYDVAINKNKINSSGADIVRKDGKDTDTITFDYDYNYWGGDGAVVTGLAASQVVDSLPYYTDEEMKQTGGAEAKIGEEYYATLQEAIDAAESGETVTVLEKVSYELDASTFSAKHGDDDAAIFVKAGQSITIDLNGKTIYAKAVLPEGATTANSGALINFGNLTIMDSSTNATGKIVFEYDGVYDGGNKRHGAIMNFGTLTVNSGTVENITNLENQPAIDTTNYSGTETAVVINNGVVKAKAYYAIDQVGYYDFAPARKNHITVNGGVIDGGIYARVQANTDIALKVTNGTVTSDFAEAIRYRVYNPGNTHAISLEGGTFEGANGVDITYTPASGETIPGFISGGTYSSDVSAFLADGYDIQRTASGYSVITEAEEITAETIHVVFYDVTKADEKESKTYEIVLKADENDEIHELASVDLNFALSATANPADAAMDITVLPAANFTLSRPATIAEGEENRYMFNYSGIGNVYQGSGNTLTIGTITVDGYGTYSISVKDVTTNVVNATTLKDNLVDSYTTGGATDGLNTTGALIINEHVSEELVGKIEGGEIEVPTYALNIEIDFPNGVEKNDAAYQQMWVSIVGGNVDKKIALGKDSVEEPTDGTVAFPANITVNDGYEIEIDLPYNTTYTVTVEGLGYRTARHSVTLTEAKTLKFWNNVKDNAETIEAGKTEMTKNFLAGEIVKDNKINVYDLSAVVSYFGQVDLNKAGETYNSNYAKYDLNRDGKIDSLDVAYVLVSWNE